MIIRVNFGDNDYGAYYEEFFKQFKFITYYECIRQLSEEEQQLNENIKKRNIMGKLYEDVFYNSEKLTVGNKRKFEKYVKESILAYMKNKVDEKTLDYLSQNTVVKLQKTYKDEWENGETVYYLINQNIVILQ